MQDIIEGWSRGKRPWIRCVDVPIIADLVRRGFGIKYHPSQIRRILHKLGFSVHIRNNGCPWPTKHSKACGSGKICRQ